MLRVGICWNQKDANGKQAKLVGIIVKIDDTYVVESKGKLPANNRPNSAGLWYYETDGVSVKPGMHTLTVKVATNGGPSVESNKITFNVTTNDVAVAPVRIRVLP